MFMPHLNKPQKPDERSPIDGSLRSGYRKIDSDGCVTFAFSKFFHMKLKKWAGLYVYIEIVDIWGFEAVARPRGPFRGEEIPLTMVKN